MKSFLFSLLPLVQAIRYSKYIQERVSCQTPIRYFLQVSLGLSLDGSQGKPSKSAYQLLLPMMFWRSPDASTAIQPLRLKLSNMLNHWLSNPQNKTPEPFTAVEGFQPLPPLKVIGAINRMIANNSTRGNRARVLLHVLGGV